MTPNELYNTYFKDFGARFYNDIIYQYRIISLEHFPELDAHMKTLKDKNRIGDHPTFQSYMESRTFNLPTALPGAKNVIVIAYFKPHAEVQINHEGKKINARIPSPYFDDFDESLIISLVRDEILNDKTKNVLFTHSIPSKTLAVSSGLACYGRNNISYVPGFGSFLSLRTILTDDEFQEVHWGEMEMLETCETCEICQKTCPNQAIQTDEFVLDVNKCLSLYNEINGVIPDWVPVNAHNALIGCLKCQYPCPANKEVIKFYKALEEITEEETEAILTGNPNEYAKQAIVDKLKMGSIEEFPYHLKTLQRNLKYLL